MSQVLVKITSSPHYKSLFADNCFYFQQRTLREIAAINHFLDYKRKTSNHTANVIEFFPYNGQVNVSQNDTIFDYLIIIIYSYSLAVRVGTCILTF